MTIPVNHPGSPAQPTALLTDHYELTMLQAALRSGAAHRPAVFEVFARHLPHGRRYGVVAGTGRLLDAIEQFRFGQAELSFLQGLVDAPTLAYLESYRFSGNIWGYAEGDCYFPGSPILVVSGTFAEAVLLETVCLSILNHDCAIASAASRMVCASGGPDGRPLIEMGSRRTHEEAAVASARAAYIAGFASTSNLAARFRYGVPSAGTAAHAFTLVHDSERDSFAAQIASLGPGTTLLVDTYDVPRAVRTAVELAGPALGAVRIDSGDLPVMAREVRTLLDSLGAVNTRILLTGDLDEYSIAALGAAPVDGYGVGTSLVTGSGAPTAALVYKLVARGSSAGSTDALVPVAKHSVGKPSKGGRKWAVRHLDPAGVASAERVSLAPAGGGLADRDLLVPLVVSGEVVGREPVDVPRARHQAALAELPAYALQLSRGYPAIPTVFGPESLRAHLNLGYGCGVFVVVDEGFAEFYEASYSHVVALLAVTAGDWGPAETTAREAFARALTQWRRLASQDAAQAWVRQVALRLAADAGRRSWRTTVRTPALLAAAQRGRAGPDPVGSTALFTALMRLPVHQRQVLVLRYLADLPVADIARDCQLPEGTVRTRLAAARQRLERELSAGSPDSPGDEELRSALAAVAAEARRRGVPDISVLRQRSRRRVVRRSLAGAVAVAVAACIGFVVNASLTGTHPAPRPRPVAGGSGNGQAPALRMGTWFPALRPLAADAGPSAAPYYMLIGYPPDGLAIVQGSVSNSQLAMLFPPGGLTYIGQR